MVKTGRIMGVACLEFRGENFRGWLKNREIRESFSLESFPLLYGIHVSANLHKHIFFFLVLLLTVKCTHTKCDHVLLV